MNLKNELPIFKSNDIDLGLLDKALSQIGAFYLAGHNVDLVLQEELIAASRNFFSRNLEDKMNFSMDKAGQAWRGYFPLAGELTSGRPDQKEGLYFGIDNDKELPLHGQNLWPNDDFKKWVPIYMQQMTQLGQELMTQIALALKLPGNYFTERFTLEPTALFRIFNYPMHTWEQVEDEWGVREHTDMGFLTMLLQDDNPGLEVKTRQEEWVEVEPLKGSFVINIGDMLEVWTHGIYRATPHRVRNKAKGDRLSLPFFFDPNWHASLEPIPKKLLCQDALKKASHQDKKRWDGLELNSLAYKMTYGEFVWNKVKDVFPKLS